MHLDQHVQKYFKSPPKTPEQTLHRRQGLGKVNRPVQQLASSYLTAANPNLCKRREKVWLILHFVILIYITHFYVLLG